MPVPLLYNAMSYPDSETKQPRGYMRLASHPLLDSVLLTLDVRAQGWRQAHDFMVSEAANVVKVRVCTRRCGGGRQRDRPWYRMLQRMRHTLFVLCGAL